jgi:predicted Fe-S protein YdhL (DUF1289 family)
MTGWRPIETPCTKVCQIDPTTGWCLGCARALIEIGNWTSFSDADRKRIIEDLENRKAKMRADGIVLPPPGRRR